VERSPELYGRGSSTGEVMMLRKVAIIGAGLTLFRRRLKETPQEMAWEAARKALDEAELELKDIDCVITSAALDAYDGVHMRGEHIAHSGGVRKTVSRVYAGGATGGMATISAWYHVASGLCDKVLVIGEEKMSHALPHPQSVFRYIWDPITEKPLNPNLIWIFAMEMYRYMKTYNVSKEEIALVSVKNKRNALNNPYAQAAANITVDDVLNSEVLVWPVNRLDVSPVSDGAGAIVVVNGDVARQFTDTPVWIVGVGWNMDNPQWSNRELAYARYVEESAMMAYKMAKIERPDKEIDVIEPHDPFDYKELHHIEGLKIAKRGEAPKLLKEGVFDLDGDIPSSPSGGLMGCGNPIGASGLLKVISIYWQLKGIAGRMQVKKPVYTGLAQNWGDLMQMSAVVIMRR